MAENYGCACGQASADTCYECDEKYVARGDMTGAPFKLDTFMEAIQAQTEYFKMRVCKKVLKHCAKQILQIAYVFACV